MKKILISAALLVAVISFHSCKDTNTAKSITKEVKFTKEGELKLKKAENDSLVASIDIEIAEGDYETQTGLMYRKGMESSQGMLFIFDTEIPRSFYMKNTEFAIDILFVNSKKEIVKIYKDAKPYDQTSLPSMAPCLYVLEVKAGMSEQWGLAEGDILSWTRS